MSQKILEAGKNIGIYLLAQTEMVEGTLNRFLSDRGFDKYVHDAVHPADELPEVAGRVCYMSFGDSRRKAGDGVSQSEKYLDNIREVGHGSVLEHPSFTFLIAGIDRNLTHELVRHRVGVGYSQLSSRYVDLRDYAVICPSSIMRRKEFFDAWIESVAKAMTTYSLIYDTLRAEGMEKKVAREDAMSVLPGAIETIMVFTVNVRALRHIFLLRGSLGAKKDIRMMSVKLWKLVNHLNCFRGITLQVDDVRGEYLVNANPKL